MSSSVDLSAASSSTQPSYDQLAHAYQQLQQRLTQAQAQITAAQTQATVAHTHNLPKPTKPNTFNGHPRTNVDAWLFEMETYLEVVGVTGDPTRVNFAVAFLRDIASTWWSSVLKEPVPPRQWDAFKARFLDRFRPLEASRTARVALMSIKQRGSVADYTNAFLRHMQLIPDMAVDDQIQFYLRGLQPHIWDEVDIKSPATLDQAMSYAQRADLRRASRRQAFAPSTRPSFHSRSDWSVSRPSQAQQAVPMELSHVSSYEQEDGYDSYTDQGTADGREEAGGAAPSTQLNAFASRPLSRRPTGTAATSRPPVKLSLEERERCMRERLCFRCRQPGHMGGRCPTYGDRRSAGQGKGRAQ
jgi:hypothetical protein